jgi:hypothetical protein
MGNLGRILVLCLVLAAAVVAGLVLARVTSGEERGPAVAICPGPDEYGYSCTGQAEAAYVDATVDTVLYLDDGVIQIELPFTFTFYGTEYDVVYGSSNGNLQFTTGNNSFDNQCLTPQPASGMGDMIAPYWDDLNLAYEGFLQTQVVGRSPERVFVIEWDDVPKFSDAADKVTFEVQLFEGSNDIVFLYEDVQTIEGPAGSQATIGIQSEEQGYALQASCNQYAVYGGNKLQFNHPEQPPEQAGLDYAGSPGEIETSVLAYGKGRSSSIVETLNARGGQGLVMLKAALLDERPPLAIDWLWADLGGDGHQEVVILSQGVDRQPELAELAVAGRQNNGRWELLWQTWPLTRAEKSSSLALVLQGDLTGDGGQEIVLRDTEEGVLSVLKQSQNDFDLMVLPEGCGSATLADEDGDSVQEIIQESCRGEGRLIVKWNGETFAIAGDR